MEKLTCKSRRTSQNLRSQGEHYMKLDKNKLLISFISHVFRMYFDFENLFNGNRALGENMNKFMNENWSDIFQELQKPIIKSFANVFNAIIGNVLSGFSYNELFLDV